jgi:hypothetical protein
VDGILGIVRERKIIINGAQHRCVKTLWEKLPTGGVKDM